MNPEIARAIEDFEAIHAHCVEILSKPFGCLTRTEASLRERCWLKIQEAIEADLAGDEEALLRAGPDGVSFICYVMNGFAYMITEPADPTWPDRPRLARYAVRSDDQKVA